MSDEEKNNVTPFRRKIDVRVKEKPRPADPTASKPPAYPPKIKEALRKWGSDNGTESLKRNREKYKGVEELPQFGPDEEDEIS